MSGSRGSNGSGPPPGRGPPPDGSTSSRMSTQQSGRGSEVRGSERGYDGGSERGTERSTHRDGVGGQTHSDWSTGKHSHASIGSHRDRPQPRQVDHLLPPNPRQRPPQQPRAPQQGQPPRHPPPQGQGPRLPPPQGQRPPPPQGQGQRPPPPQGQGQRHPPPPRGPPPAQRAPGPPRGPPPPRQPHLALPAPGRPSPHTQTHRHGETPRNMPPIVEEPATRTNTAASQMAPPSSRQSLASDRSGQMVMMDVTNYEQVMVIKPAAAPDTAARAAAPRAEIATQTEMLIIAREGDNPGLRTPGSADTSRTRTKLRAADVDFSDNGSDLGDLDYLIEPDPIVFDDHSLPMTREYYKYINGKKHFRPTTSGPVLPGVAPIFDDDEEDHGTAVIDKYAHFHRVNRKPMPQCAHCNRTVPKQSPIGIVKIQRHVGRQQIYWYESEAEGRDNMPGGAGGCANSSCCCHGNHTVKHTRSMATLPSDPVIHVGVDKDDPHLSDNSCFCGRPKSPELMSDSTYLGK